MKHFIHLQGELFLNEWDFSVFHPTSSWAVAADEWDRISLIDKGNIIKFFADNDGEDNLIVTSNGVIFDTALSQIELQALGAPGTALPEPSLLARCALSLFGFLRRRRQEEI